MEIRDETRYDHAAVRRLHLACFEGQGEADLVEALRRDGDAVLSLVGCDGEEIVGHVMFSRMRAPFAALGLAPVAVAPPWRRRGIARTLIGRGLSRARSENWAGIFVVGDPAYYRRFGFGGALAAGFASPYAGPYLMAICLVGKEFEIRTGRVDYAPAFAALG